MTNTVSRLSSALCPAHWRKRVGAPLSLSILTLSLLPPLRAQTPGLGPVTTSVTVVEKVTAEAPGSVTVLDQSAVNAVPGINLDDRLRMVPGFSLFRRSSSIVANPTTQGVSLRGVGSTGASRSLVLWDGVPINDPFGGWVYWTRFDPLEMDRVEVSRGASTSVFGDQAMSGAIALFSRPPEKEHLYGGYEGGTQNTHEVYARYTNLWKRFAVSGGGRAFTTDGYYIVPEYARGPIDRKANVRFAGGDTTLDWLGDSDRFALKFDMLAEERGNGTYITYNSTSLGEISGNYSHAWKGESLNLLGYHEREEYHASFSSIGADRASERMTLLQSVPAEATGGAALYRISRSAWNGLFGLDVQNVEGYSHERVFPSGGRVSGSSLLQRGFFGQTDFAAGPVRFYLGARQHYTGQGTDFFNPSGGFAAGRGRFRLRGSVYRSFRAPTLNELYRQFRVGNAVTLANAQLLPESLFGAEAGVDYRGEKTRASLTLFRNDLRDLITNVTLSLTPSLITRQRQNAAAALSKGAEFDVRRRWGSFEGSLGYLFSQSAYSNGRYLPQIPRHQGSAQLTYQHQGTLVAAGIRPASLQFEDDLNQFRLAGYAVAQLSVQQRITRSLSGILAVENMLDKTYEVGFSPTVLIGAPRQFRAGLRWDGKIR